jgi:hypothetical protein
VLKSEFASCGEYSFTRKQEKYSTGSKIHPQLYFDVFFKSQHDLSWNDLIFKSVPLKIDQNGKIYSALKRVKEQQKTLDRYSLPRQKSSSITFSNSRQSSLRVRDKTKKSLQKSSQKAIGL